jgi:hypothetical protein
MVFRLLSVAGVGRYEEREGIAGKKRERIFEIYYSMDMRWKYGTQEACGPRDYF